MSVNKRKKVCMKTNDDERLVRKPEKHIRHLVLNARDLPRHLAFDLALETGSSVGNATSLALLRHFLAFTSIRRAGQRTSGVRRQVHNGHKCVDHVCSYLRKMKTLIAKWRVKLAGRSVDVQDIGNMRRNTCFQNFERQRRRLGTDSAMDRSRCRRWRPRVTWLNWEKWTARWVAWFWTCLGFPVI